MNELVRGTAETLMTSDIFNTQGNMIYSSSFTHTDASYLVYCVPQDGYNVLCQLMLISIFVLSANNMGHFVYKENAMLLYASWHAFHGYFVQN